MILMYIVAMSLFISPIATNKKEAVEFPLAESDDSYTPQFLENWWLWIGISFALIFFAYLIPIMHLIQHAPPGSSGYKTW